MISKREKKQRSVPALSTASLPDIIFMLLFFFMVVTNLRQNEVKVKANLPKIESLTKIENRSLVNHISIGSPLDSYQSIYGDRTRIQLGDKFAELSDIRLFIEQHRNRFPSSEQEKISTSLKIDSDVKMGIVTDVKTELRKVNQLRLIYAARPK